MTGLRRSSALPVLMKNKGACTASTLGNKIKHAYYIDLTARIQSDQSDCFVIAFAPFLICFFIKQKKHQSVFSRRINGSPGLRVELTRVPLLSGRSPYLSYLRFRSQQIQILDQSSQLGPLKM